jgi:receptor protein-tyrosine kinase
VNPSDQSPLELLDTDPERILELVEQHGLSAADAQRVLDASRRTGSSFAQAARELGLLKANESPAETIPAIHKSTTSPGLVEVAIQRQRLSTSRELALRQGTELTPGAELRHSVEAFHPRSEKMRSLRTELLLLAEPAQHANVIAVMSANSGEGRSQLAAELAISFAQLGRRTLLVDADLRQPRQHVLFGDTNDSGLADALESNVSPLLHPIAGPPQMFLCKAGPVRRNPLELLSDGAFGRVLFDWRRAYEFIVVDTPPLSQFADALAVASVVGRVLLVTRTQHTSFKDLRGLLRRLEGSRAQVLGAVMQDFKSEATSSRGWWSRLQRLRQIVP